MVPLKTRAWLLQVGDIAVWFIVFEHFYSNKCVLIEETSALLLLETVKLLPWCGDRPTLAHIPWDCRKKPTEINSPQIAGKISAREQWETLLAREDLGVQLALLDQVQWAAKASGALE